MYPEQSPKLEQQPTTPKKKSLKLPLVLMLWPIIAVILAIVASLLVNSVLQDTSVSADDSNPAKSILNIVIFLVGGGATIIGPISFIIGLVLLIQRKSRQ